MKRPLVSVLLITYNHEGYIEETVNSIFTQNSDKYDIELLVVDDRSSDHTQKILTKLNESAPMPMYVYLKEHKGVASITKNLNELIWGANGDYIAFLAGDDKYFNERFDKHIDMLESNRKIMLVYSYGENYRNNEYLNNALRPSDEFYLKNAVVEYIFFS